MGAKTACKTVGELKKALESIPDDVPVAMNDVDVGEDGLAFPFVASHRWETEDHLGFLTEEQAIEQQKDQRKAKPKKLDRPVCVLQPAWRSE